LLRMLGLHQRRRARAPPRPCARPNGAL